MLTGQHATNALTMRLQVLTYVCTYVYKFFLKVEKRDKKSMTFKEINRINLKCMEHLSNSIATLDRIINRLDDDIYNIRPELEEIKQARKQMFDEMKLYYQEHFRIPSDLLSQASELGQEIIRYMATSGLYATKDMYLSGTKKGILRIIDEISKKNLKMNVVKQCINEVIEEAEKGEKINKTNTLSNKIKSL